MRGRYAFAAGLLTGVLGALLLVHFGPGDDGDLRHYREVRDFARSAFVREVSAEELLDDALHGLIEGLDEYSRYYDRPAVPELERETRGRYAGFGVVFRRPFNRARVLFTIPGSPAERAGVRVGDAVLALGGETIAGMSEEEVHAILSDDETSDLRFQLRGLDGEERELLIERTSLIDPTVRHTRLIDDEHGIGYIALGSFSHETPAELDQAFRTLRERGMRALVLDLRGNFGGVLTSAVDVAGRFVEQGVLVSTEGRGEPIVYEADPSEAWYVGFPLVVLVDASSASASEVLAGALQDHRAAVLCGSPTYGKGMVQTIRQFSSFDAVAKVTTSYYYTPAHRNLDRSATGRERGLQPDLDVELNEVERRAIHAWLERYSPPVGALPALRAWEEQEGVSLIDPQPDDAQLDAALELLRGRRPPYGV